MCCLLIVFVLFGSLTRYFFRFLAYFVNFLCKLGKKEKKIIHVAFLEILSETKS